VSLDSEAGSPSIRRAVIVAVALLGGVAALALLWRTTDLGAYAEPRRIHEMLHSIGDSPWSIPIVWLVFVAAGLLMVPVNALFVAVGLTFGFLEAVGLSMSGALLSTLVVDFIGRRFDIDPLFERAPEWLRRLKQQRLAEAGLPQLALMRILPLGPFSTVNLIWGAAGVPRRRVLAATVIGLTPGVLATSAIGEGLGLALEDFGARSIGLLLGGVVALGILMWLGRRLLRRRLERGGDAGSETDDSRERG
jgi:uncharacterized membrane protein YdjX (TVP38/TMEM64 family)